MLLTTFNTFVEISLLPRFLRIFFKLDMFPAINSLIALRQHDLGVLLRSTEWTNRRMDSLRVSLSEKGF